MKELKRLGLLAIMGLGMISCGGDDDSSSETGLDGLWKQEKIIVDGDPSLTEDDPCLTKNTMKFDGGVFTGKSYDGENCLDEDVDNGTYIKSGDKLTVISDGESRELEILKLTADKLELELNELDEGEVIKAVFYFNR